MPDEKEEEAHRIAKRVMENPSHYESNEIMLARELIRLRKDGEEEWTCGHIAGAMCQECFRLLAVSANELAQENLDLRERLDSAERLIDALKSAAIAPLDPSFF